VSYGVKGLAATSSGIGVWGRTNSTGVGVRGEALNGVAEGVLGTNTATTGLAVGVQGESSSTSGWGVYGRSNSSTGTGQGVRGWTNSPNGYGLFSSGDFGGTGAKYFIQPHPQDPTKQIQFVCLEGNEAGTYFRGTGNIVGGMAVIEVPEDFRLVSEPNGLTAQITVVGAPAVTWIEHQDLERIVVRATDDVEFHYFVNGVRRGFAETQTIRENTSFVPTTRGVAYGNQYPPALRQILVDNGILTPDFFPNEATATSMGWYLEDAEADRNEE
jgi:hypothetical protein